jgi:hypothetical protein
MSAPFASMQLCNCSRTAVVRVPRSRSSCGRWSSCSCPTGPPRRRLPSAIPTAIRHSVRATLSLPSLPGLPLALPAHGFATGSCRGCHLHPAPPERSDSCIRRRRRDSEACVIDERTLNRVQVFVRCPRRRDGPGRAVASLTPGSALTATTRPPNRLSLCRRAFQCAAPAGGWCRSTSVNASRVTVQQIRSDRSTKDRMGATADRERPKRWPRKGRAASKGGSHPMHLRC